MTDLIRTELGRSAGGPARRRPGRGLIAVLTALAVAILAGVVWAVPKALDAFRGEKLTASCGIVVDGSGSSNAKNGFDVDDQIAKSVPGFLTGQNCATVAFAPIDGTSGSSPCKASPIAVDPEVSGGNVNRDALRTERRTTVLKRVNELAKCIRSDPRSRGGSDILGGLKRMLGQRPDTGKFTLLVVSDFENYDNDFSLVPKTGTDISTPEKRTAVIDMLEREDRLPDFTNTEMYTAGFGVAIHAVPEQFTHFEQFWIALLDRVGLPEKDFHR